MLSAGGKLAIIQVSRINAKSRLVSSWTVGRLCDDPYAQCCIHSLFQLDYP